jgi:hypothetical protein
VNGQPTSPAKAIADLAGQLHGMPVFIAGSCVAAHTYGHQDFADLDVFTPSQPVLFATVQRLLDNGYVLTERYDRVWQRWLRFGLKGWHTNSAKLESLDGIETNVVFKIVDSHPTTSLGQVLESFDFGLLGRGYDVEHDQWRDMRPYLFPGMDPQGPLPLMPNKRFNWRKGFVSQYNGLREAGRYTKYHGYGYDMSLVADDLVLGYRMAALYHAGRFDERDKALAEIYQSLADRIEGHEIDELVEFYRTLDFNDPLDEIMSKLE